MVTVSYSLKTISDGSLLIEKTVTCGSITEAMKFLDRLKKEIKNKYTLVGKPVIGEKANG